MKNEMNFGRCDECGGRVALRFGPGRTREFLRGLRMDVPEDFGTPACERCGEEYMVPEVSEPLDELLGREFARRVQTTEERGGEAEELRCAIENLIEWLEPDTDRPEGPYARGRQDVAREIAAQLREILDAVDARDSLAFLEAQLVKPR